MSSAGHVAAPRSVLEDDALALPLDKFRCFAKAVLRADANWTDAELHDEARHDAEQPDTATLCSTEVAAQPLSRPALSHRELSMSSICHDHRGILICNPSARDCGACSYPGLASRTLARCACAARFLARRHCPLVTARSRGAYDSNATRRRLHQRSGCGISFLPLASHMAVEQEVWRPS